MAMNMDYDRDVTFEIMEHIGVISTYATGWQKELNLVSWNGGTPKYDIRDWDPEHEHMSRGITLHEKEMRLVLDLVRKRRAVRNHSTRFGEEGKQEGAETVRSDAPELPEGSEAAANREGLAQDPVMQA